MRRATALFALLALAAAAGASAAGPTTTTDPVITKEKGAAAVRLAALPAPQLGRRGAQESRTHARQARARAPEALIAADRRAAIARA